jgi:hypothetical protein
MVSFLKKKLHSFVTYSVCRHKVAAGSQPLGAVLLLGQVLPDLVVGVGDDQVDDLISDQEFPNIHHSPRLFRLCRESLGFAE